MKYFITGVCGFIGSHLYNKLVKQGHQVKGIDNLYHPCKNEVPFDFKDIRYYEEIEPYVKWADVVYHLAAQIHVDRSIESPKETYDINVLGTLNVLEAVRKHNKKMVFASSSEVYGTSQSSISYWPGREDVLNPMREEHPLDAQSPYAASKLAGDRLCYSYWKTYGIKVAILRNFNTFGEYQNDGSYGGVIAIFTRQALAGEPITVNGDGGQERDYMYIGDALKGYELLVKKNVWGKPVNIGTGKTIKILELAKMIKEITKSKSKIVFRPERPGEVQRLCADVVLAESIGFKCETDFKKNLNQYIKWYENFNRRLWGNRKVPKAGIR